MGIHHGAQNHHCGLSRDKPLPGTLSKEKLGTASSVKAPAQHRGKGKAAQGRSQKHRCTSSIYVGKCQVGQLSSQVRAVGNGYAADQDHQGRQGTDGNGVQKYFHDPHQSLLGRMVRLGRGVGNGCRPHPGLVGKHAPGTANPQCLKGRAQHPAGYGSGRKGPLENLPERIIDPMPP